MNISLSIRSPGYTTFSLLNSAEHEIYEGLDGGSDIHYSLKIKPIINLIKIKAYSLK